MAPPLLAALAAIFAPARGARSLARHPDGSLEAEAARLAPLPRSERLAALADALARLPRPSRAAAGSAATRERPALAALLRSGAGAGVAPPLRRLVEEREWE
ncbi:MAG TPA: hypothetical protein VEB43_11720 [Anaeromyxobacter sp.]|nr:hypothetical protein [Anaeromyxobacter sp.]